MATIVSKANRVSKPVMDSSLEISAEIPSDLVELNALGNYFDEQARKIDDLFAWALPGGAYDRLLGRMLARKATHFVIGHKEKDSPNEPNKD